MARESSDRNLWNELDFKFYGKVREDKRTLISYKIVKTTYPIPSFWDIFSKEEEPPTVEDLVNCENLRKIVNP